MTTVRASAGAALIGLVLLVLSSPAYSYPDTTPTVKLSVSSKVLVGGKAFTAKASADTSCVWAMTYLKQHAAGSGSSLSHRFTTPVVSKRTKTTVTVRCSYDPTGAARPTAGGQTSTVSRSATVTLLPRSSGHGHTQGHSQGHQHAGVPGNPKTGGQSPAGPAHHGGGLLPDTGGFAWWWLLVAAVLVGGGATVATRGRRTER